MEKHQDNKLNRSDMYYKEVGRIPSLTAGTEKTLRDAVTKGAISKKHGIEKLISGNLRLVITIAKRYADKGMPLEDLIQAGNIGLIEAANAFDWSRDTYFSSYATHHIRKEIILCLRQANAVVLPDKEYQLVQKYERYINTHDFPNDDKSMAQCAAAIGATISKLQKLIDGELHTPICDGLYYKDADGNSKQIDLPDTSFDEDAFCDEVDIMSLIEMAAAKLQGREKEVFFMYYGIRRPKMNYEQIGKKYRKNKQWAHREVQKAILHLRQVA